MSLGILQESYHRRMNGLRRDTTNTRRHDGILELKQGGRRYGLILVDIQGCSPDRLITQRVSDGVGDHQCAASNVNDYTLRPQRLQHAFIDHVISLCPARSCNHEKIAPLCKADDIVEPAIAGLITTCTAVVADFHVEALGALCHLPANRAQAEDAHFAPRHMRWTGDVVAPQAMSDPTIEKRHATNGRQQNRHAWSATAESLVPAALQTGMPRSFAASRSTFSKPTPSVQ